MRLRHPYFFLRKYFDSSFFIKFALTWWQGHNSSGQNAASKFADDMNNDNVPEFKLCKSSLESEMEANFGVRKGLIRNDVPYELDLNKSLRLCFNAYKLQ
ncbi:hypothetical protein TNIN_219241 [Trichonephila inaurata madagascariensis]|uniref:Uncharacterized protein n=1 Tax=Trichonephila inaurata madagascariensis TaxID=2747483 RepID=A0A8X6WX75_9ARAC|nr:hypothetical protein TNIN_219241 [Trichonephila inaurata madagascariensis]